MKTDATPELPATADLSLLSSMPAIARGQSGIDISDTAGARRQRRTQQRKSRRVQSMRLMLPKAFLEAVHSKSKVSECPHNLYKYPARFAPEFAREAIRAFSRRGDVVLDVFQGGGTSLIEAIALGRQAVGYDISQLACFIARTKTTPLTIHDERALVQWANQLSETAPAQALAAWAGIDTDEGYYRKNLPEPALEFFSGVIHALERLDNRRQRQFARLILLAVGQAALDCKKLVPTAAAMRAEFQEQLVTNVRAFRAYTRKTSRDLGVRPAELSLARKIVRASSELCGAPRRAPQRKASLIVTSPPYPGVHMLYHRWQILGRRETPAPFVLADCRDGDGISYYCLGNRFEQGLATYYQRLTKVFAAAKKKLKPTGLVIQLVAFNDPTWQLPAFLAAMDKAGFKQVFPELPESETIDGNLWRAVPGRKWYVGRGARTGDRRQRSDAF